LIEIYLRDGHSLCERTETVEVVERVKEKAREQYDQKKQKSYSAYLDRLSTVECFPLKALPNSNFSRYLRKLRDRLVVVDEETGDLSGAVNDPHIPFEQMNPYQIVTFLEYISAPKTTVSVRITSHSLRKSAVIWGILCGALESQMRSCGRWRSTASFDLYVRAGNTIVELYKARDDGVEDPIRKIWVFHPTVFDYSKSVIFRLTIKFILNIL
jgi:hypothetical protein